MKNLLLLGATTLAISTAQSQPAQDWGPMPWPTIVNEPTMRDFSQAAHMLEQTASDKTYADTFATYRMCTELQLRALVPHKIDDINAMIYTAVRGCTRQMDDYVLLFVRDDRYKANYYVAHAVQRLAQQEQISDLLPLANRVRAGDNSTTTVVKK